MILSFVHFSITGDQRGEALKRDFFKWANPGLFLFIFSLFKQTLQFLQQINVKKCHVHPVSGAGIRTHDLLERESPPITTRPGLPPKRDLYRLVKWSPTNQSWSS